MFGGTRDEGYLCHRSPSAQRASDGVLLQKNSFHAPSTRRQHATLHADNAHLGPVNRCSRLFPPASSSPRHLLGAGSGWGAPEGGTDLGLLSTLTLAPPFFFN
ncbi:hypothetical protein C0Q70_17526 [Pomacea canaliculata]|uniref:Uncharacterized protein n=1 Tax=Pomacea canaliculata TaxID=400727 RepID=A0A2T7NKP1_POMCA|nr:hypothetical protein C0Q70_17526 [Pomacea canaliculata]